MKKSSLLAPTLFAALVACQSPAQRADAPAASLMSEVTAKSLFDRGLVAHRNGDSTRAEQYLAAALEKGYPAHEALPILVAACLQSERFDTALYYSRAHLTRNPNNASLRYLVASLHFAVGQDDRAQTQLEQVIDEAPQLAEAHFLLGLLAHERLRDPRLARRALNKYLALAPHGAHSAEAKSMLQRPPTGKIK